MRLPENPGPWRSDNIVRPEQIEEIRDYLITPELILAKEPLVYRLPPSNKHQFRTLAVTSNFFQQQKRHPLSFMSAAIQEQTHLTLGQALAHHEPFYGRRHVFEIGLDVAEGPEGKIPADMLYLNCAHYDTTTLRQLEREVGDRLLTYMRHLRSNRENPDDDLDEAIVAVHASRRSFLRLAGVLRSRAAYDTATIEEADMLLAALGASGMPIPCPPAETLKGNRQVL